MQVLAHDSTNWRTRISDPGVGAVLWMGKRTPPIRRTKSGSDADIFFLKSSPLNDIGIAAKMENVKYLWKLEV
jgi:hypothetical protein